MIMVENSLSTLSESMQMYIVTIARLWEGSQPVPLSKLAEAFAISPVSVNEMCRKLQDNGLVNYQPYKGASLTPEGEEKANYILRRHRLWEVFLTNQLGMNFAEAHEIACQLEHTTSDILADRLDAFLDYPATNPIGEQIPRGNLPADRRALLSLDMLSAGQQGQVIRCEAEGAALAFLQNAGLQPGVWLTVEAIAPGGALLRLLDGKVLSISQALERTIKVALAEGDREYSTNETPAHPPGIDDQKEASKVKAIAEQASSNQSVVKNMTLDHLKVGQHGVVVRVAARGQIRQRLIDMGLVPGSEIKVVRVAPLGDPIEFTVKGYNLSLRKSEASQIEVEVVA